MLKKILIIGSKVVDRQLLKDLLALDYAIMEASNGQEALDRLASQGKMLSAVLLDLELLELEEPKFWLHLQSYQHLPLIMVTEKGAEEAQVKALTLGVKDFIVRPFNSELVRNCLRNNILLYEAISALQVIQKEQLLEKQITSEMRTALAERQFEVWFQPQYNHSNGALIGAEALVRWRHPQRGLIPPGDFLPLFEQNGFIYELDQYVWREVCHYLRKWANEGRLALPVSVNISPYDLVQTDLLEVLVGIIKEFELPIKLLRLEITESAFSDSSKENAEIVKQLIRAGFIVEIDDFGGGCSSLNTLKNIPAQVVKLDMGFLEDDEEPQRSGSILESIARMTKWLGMAMLAEGVEEKEQADFLKSIGCLYVQGYLYAHPMPALDYEKLCRSLEKSPFLLETVSTFAQDSFWDLKSIDTLVFNNYSGCSCVYEYRAGSIELIRITDKYIKMVFGSEMSVDKLMKINWKEHTAPQTDEAIRKAMEQSIATKREVTGEYLFVNLPGCPPETYLRSSLQVLASAGDSHLIYCVSENITAQRQAERKKQEAEQRGLVAVTQLQLVLSNIDSAVLATVFEKDKPRIVFANEQYYAQFGYSKEEYESENPNPFAFIHPEDRERAIQLANQSNLNQEPYSISYRIVHRDGSVRWRQSHVSFFNFPGEELPVQLAVAADITALMEAEQKALDPMSLVFKEDLPQLKEQIGELIRGEKPVQYIYRVHTKGGGYKWINLKTVLSRRQGTAVVAYSVFFDVTVQQEILERLHVSEQENLLALQHSKNVVCRYEVATKNLTVSPSVSPKFEMPLIVPNVPYGEVQEGKISADTAKAYTEFYESIIRGEKNGKLVYQRKSIIGWRWLEAHFSTIFADDGKPASAVISFNDVTEELEKEKAYKKWKQSLQDRDPESYSLFRCNINKKVAFDSVEGSLLYIQFRPGSSSFDEHIEEYVSKCVINEDSKQFAAFLNPDTLLANYYQGKCIITLEYREKLPEGSFRWIRLTVDLVESPHSADIEAYLLFENIDEAKRTELSTLERAENDPLTGLLNRATFTEKVNELLQASSPQTQHALLMLDVDGFKLVNDVFGHGAGDQVLIDIADLLRTIVRQGDLVGRLGGDEFVVFLSNIPDDEVAASKAKQICDLTRKAFTLEVQISGSVGIVLYPRDGKDFARLYRKADETLYYVKGSGKNNYAFYYEDMDTAYQEPIKNEVEAVTWKWREKKRRMLIVDDSQIDCQILANMFKNDFAIEEAGDGRSALIRLRHYGSAISVVLLDLMMPGINGFAVLEKMQQSVETKSIPVIVVSGDDNRETSLKAIQMGATDFVMKPVDPDILRIRVQSAISKAENERLRAKNSYLELQNDEMNRYRTVLDRIGLVVMELDWGKGFFSYSPDIANHLAGKYDTRTLWHILLSDLVADAQTVSNIQQYIHNVADDRSRTEGSLKVQLKAASGKKHEFCMNVYKLTNEYGLTNKLILTFKDEDQEIPTS